MDSREKLNHFLVKVFHEILRTEEACVREGGYQDLSVSEMHVIEAVCMAEESGKNNARDIAETLRITPGSLSVSLNVLEGKGYILRERDAQDRRKIRISATPRGKKADKDHERFHHWMIDHVLGILSPEETEVFVRALEGVGEFFAREGAKRRTRPRGAGKAKNEGNQHQ